MKKVTLDHNCIIHLENNTAIGTKIRTILADASNECFVVNIGASEMRKGGVRPDHYDRFEDLLTKCGIEHLQRLDPVGIWGITFWDRCLWSDETIDKETDAIYEVLFGDSPKLNLTENFDSHDGRIWVNRVCDVQTLWCHVRARNDVFLTTDGNFSKATKLPKLIALGAQRICHPDVL